MRPVLTWINVTLPGSGSHELWLAAPFAKLARNGADNDVCNGGGIWDCDLRCYGGGNAAVFGGASPGSRPLDCSSHAGGGAALSKLDFSVKKGIR